MDFILKIVLNSRILIRSTPLQLKLKSLSEIEKNNKYQSSDCLPF